MAKKLSEIYAPKPKGEKEFVAKHTVKKTTDKSPATKDDARFKATNVKTFERGVHRFGYDVGKDVKAYDSNAAGVTDQKNSVAVAPYTVKMGEGEEIEEGKKTPAQSDNGPFKSRLGKKAGHSYLDPHDPRAKSLSKSLDRGLKMRMAGDGGHVSKFRKEDINDDNIDDLLDMINEYLKDSE